jgi:hypothetical protein
MNRKVGVSEFEETDKLNTYVSDSSRVPLAVTSRPFFLRSHHFGATTTWYCLTITADLRMPRAPKVPASAFCKYCVKEFKGSNRTHHKKVHEAECEDNPERVVYRCSVCDRVWDKNNSIRAHFKRARDTGDECGDGVGARYMLPVC